MIATKGDAARDAVLDAAQRRLVDDGVVQLALPSDAPSPVPDWLTALLHWLNNSGPFWHYGRYVLWAGLAVIGLLLGRLLWSWARTRNWSRATVDANVTQPWRPAEAQARALLAEADRLAAEARFAEAAHLLLLRSVEQIAARRPEAVRPALTSRDIAKQPGLPDDIRRAFEIIAALVERSLFGGSSVDADGWTQCRRVYADAAFARAWA